MSARELRDARTRMGLSVEEAAARTRIPQRYVEALERGDLSVFGKGPFASGYTRQYRRFLGLPDAPLAPEPEAEPEPTVTHTSPVIPSGRRLVALGVAVALVLLLTALVGRSLTEGPAAGDEVGTAPDQTVLLTTGEPLRAKIVADARIVFSGVIPAGQQQKYAAHDRLELELPRLDGVTLVYNGRTLKPLGSQSRPRRLVFVDDRES